MNKPQRQHPAAILRYTSRFLFLLLVPLARGLRHIRSPHGLYVWLKGGWIDLLAAGLILALAGLAWWRHTYRLTPHSLTLQRGILLRRTTVIPLRNVTTLTAERRLLSRPFGVVRVNIDTEAGHRHMADATLLIGRRQAACFLPDTPAGDAFRPARVRLLLLSVLFSNSLSGVLLLTILLRQLGVLLGKGVQQLVLDNLQAAADAVTVIPRTAVLLGLILLGGWLITAAGHVLRHLPFTAHRREATLVISTGWLTRRTHICGLDAIHYTDHRQTLAARLLRRTTVYISCTGYGKDKNTLAVLVPPAGYARAATELAALLPACTPVPLTVRPAVSALWRYGRAPFMLGLGLLLFGRRLAGLLPLWAASAAPLVELGALPCLWLLAMRLAALCHAGIGCQGGRLTLCYSRRLTLHRVTVSLSHITAVRVRQSLFQRWSGRCDVLIYTANEAHRPHRIRQLPLAGVEALHKLFRKEE